MLSLVDIVYRVEDFSHTNKWMPVILYEEDVYQPGMTRPMYIDNVLGAIVMQIENKDYNSLG